jgi:prepilin-type N-terminal cleavage/methylation domain-containing protein
MKHHPSFTRENQDALMQRQRVRDNNYGFTIIELMIALSVLATILVMATVILIQIGALYSKGVNAADLQNAARNIQDDVASAIRFGGYAPASGSATEGSLQIYAVCIGNTRYSFIKGAELGYDSGTSPPATTDHVIWRDTMNQSTSCIPIGGQSGLGSGSFIQPSAPVDSFDPSGNGYEMAPLHTRLTQFSVTEENPIGSGIYNIVVWMEYGDSDLLNLAASPPTCKGSTGQQFCAVSTLSTTAARRLDN